MYTSVGILTGMTGKKRLIPWDGVREVKLRDGSVVVRHTLCLRDEHFPIFVAGNGVGGFAKKRDSGAILIVDKLNAGQGAWIDYLEHVRS